MVAINLSFGGEIRKFAGTIAYISGDNLGSQYLGGLKQGSQSHRKCRVCMGNATEITMYVYIVTLIMVRATNLMSLLGL